MLVFFLILVHKQPCQKPNTQFRREILNPRLELGPLSIIYDYTRYFSGIKYFNNICISSVFKKRLICLL